MKRLFILTALIVCLTVGIVYAANIARVVDPQNQSEVWITEVYNDAGKELTVGEVVVWDNGDGTTGIADSTGDNDNYVTVTTTADTNLVAGVVYPTNIASGANGTIAIYGMVDVYVADVGCTVDDILCSSTTTDHAKDCTTDSFGFAICQEATGATGLAKCFINPRNQEEEK